MQNMLICLEFGIGSPIPFSTKLTIKQIEPAEQNNQTYVNGYQLLPPSTYESFNSL